MAFAPIIAAAPALPEIYIDLTSPVVIDLCGDSPIEIDLTGDDSEMAEDPVEEFLADDGLQFREALDYIDHQEEAICLQTLVEYENSTCQQIPSSTDGPFSQETMDHFVDEFVRELECYY